MVKFLSENDGELIFNYLGKSRSALLSCVTEFYPESYIENGIFAMQYINGLPVSLCCCGETFSLLFTTDKSEIKELLFAANNQIHTAEFLPFKKIGEYYLLQKEILPNALSSLENKGNYEDFKFVVSQNGGTETVNLQYLFKKGCLTPLVLSQDGEKIGGGFIINSENYSVISHIFVEEKFRRKGFGTEIVKNLLKMCKSKNVYLTSEENNLEFYGKLGFTPVLTVNKYNISNIGK